jgi:branched-chain amino acid transport system ATP-binding protein
VHALVAIADRVMCIDRGRLLVEGAPEEVMNSHALQEIYLGVMVT